jgi:Tfp pilus assembly protein PilN
MANENQNTGASNLPGGNRQGSSQSPNIRDSLKELLEDQGDYNNMLKNAISDLKKMDSAYGKIEARLNSLNKNSINVKQVQQELYKLKQKEYIEGKKLEDLAKSVDQKAIDELERVKRITTIQQERAKARGKTYDQERAMMEILKKGGNIESITLYAAEKKLQISMFKKPIHF